MDHNTIARLSVVEDETLLLKELVRKSRLFVHPPESSLKLPELLRLDIKLDTVPTHSEGIVFGSRPSCDVVLPRHPTISYEQFSLTFDDSNRLIVRDLSKNGTQVTYSGHGIGFLENRSWIINDKNIPASFQDIEIAIAGGLIKLKVELYLMSSMDSKYTGAVDLFRSRCETLPSERATLVDKFDSVRLWRTKGMVTMDSPVSEATWLSFEAGTGTTGCVVGRWNVHDGSQMAIKSPRTKTWKKRQWEKEVEILSRICHHHIVKIEDSQPIIGNTVPEIHLEYIGGGTLEAAASFSAAEIKSILSQCLSSLMYLHGQTPAIVHRDVNPSNILINVRDETGICVKLADLGEANTDGIESLVTDDTLFSAPEIFDSECSTSLDIWGLGLTILSLIDQKLQMLYGSDEETFFAELNAHEDEMVRFLREHMLAEDSDGRSNAATCFEKLHALQEVKRCPCVRSGDRVTPVSDIENEDEGGTSQQAASTVAESDNSSDSTIAPDNKKPQKKRDCSSKANQTTQGIPDHPAEIQDRKTSQARNSGSATEDRATAHTEQNSEIIRTPALNTHNTTQTRALKRKSEQEADHKCKRRMKSSLERPNGDE